MTRYATIDRYAYEPDAPQGLSGMVGATRSGREYVVDPMGETGPTWAAVLEPRAGDAVVSMIAVGVSRDAAFDACERQEARLWDDGTMTEGDRMPPGRPSPAGFPACRICGCWEYGACWDDDVGACWVGGGRPVFALRSPASSGNRSRAGSSPACNQPGRRLMIDWREGRDHLHDHLVAAYGEGPPGAGGRCREYGAGADDGTGVTWSASVYDPAWGDVLPAMVGRDLRSRAEAMRACEHHEARLLVAQARSLTRQALEFRESRPSSDDHGAWRVNANSLIRRAGRIDLAVPGVRAAVEAEVVVSGLYGRRNGRRGQAPDAEKFLSAFRVETEGRLKSHREADSRQRSQQSGARGGVHM